MYVTETPWPGIILCGLVALLCLFAYGAQQRRKYLVAALLSVALSPVFVLWDDAVETEREQIENAIVAMANDFRHGHADRVVEWIDPESARLRAVVFAASELVSLTSDVRITSMDIELLSGNNQATADFRANADLDVRGFGNVGRQPTRWLLTWRKDQDRWRIVEIERRNPLTGEPIGILAKST